MHVHNRYESFQCSPTRRRCEGKEKAGRPSLAATEVDGAPSRLTKARKKAKSELDITEKAVFRSCSCLQFYRYRSSTTRWFLAYVDVCIHEARVLHVPVALRGPCQDHCAFSESRQVDWILKKSYSSRFCAFLAVLFFLFASQMPGGESSRAGLFISHK